MSTYDTIRYDTIEE